jgi:hypothetical protein
MVIPGLPRGYPPEKFFPGRYHLCQKFWGISQGTACFVSNFKESANFPFSYVIKL